MDAFNTISRIAMSVAARSCKAPARLSVALGAGIFAPAVHAATTVKLGYVSPRTGPLAAFGEPDDFIIKGFLDGVKGGLKSAAPRP